MNRTAPKITCVSDSSGKFTYMYSLGMLKPKNILLKTIVGAILGRTLTI